MGGGLRDAWLACTAVAGSSQQPRLVKWLLWTAMTQPALCSVRVLYYAEWASEQGALGEPKVSKVASECSSWLAGWLWLEWRCVGWFVEYC